MSAESEQLIRLSQVLAERGTSPDRVLEAITAAGSSNVYLGFAALSSRLEVMLPVNRVYLDLAVPGLDLPDPAPARGVIRLSAEGSQLAAAVVEIGTVPARTAVDELAPMSARSAWLAVVEPLLAAGGKIMNRTRYLTEERSVISVAFSARSGDAEARFASTLDDHMARIGFPEARRELWRRLYTVIGAGRVLSVTTECTPSGPSSHLGVLDDHTSFDHAIDLVKLMSDVNTARLAAMGLGAISGTFGVDRLMGVESVLGQSPELFVWLPPRTT